MANVMTKVPPRKPINDGIGDRIGGVRAIADLVPAIGDTAFRKFGFVQSALLTRWPEIVGNRLARVSQPESLRFARGTKAEGTLRLTVTSAAAPMVHHLTGDVMASVNRFFGYRAVAKVTLVQGTVSRAARPAQHATAPAAATNPPASPTASPASVRNIGDPELRTVLEGLAASLSRHGSPPKIS
jgi:hypothetical protein